MLLLKIYLKIEKNKNNTNYKNKDNVKCYGFSNKLSYKNKF